MYEFHYISKGIKYVCGAKLMFADTDSLVETDCLYEDVYEAYLILAIIRTIHNFIILLIKKVISKMKDEIRRRIINGSVGLKSKIYSFVMVDKKEIKRVKAINKNLVNRIRHKENVDVLIGRSLTTHNMKRIQQGCNLHRIETLMFVKLL